MIGASASALLTAVPHLALVSDGALAAGIELARFGVASTTDRVPARMQAAGLSAH